MWRGGGKGGAVKEEAKGNEGEKEGGGSRTVLSLNLPDAGCFLSCFLYRLSRLLFTLKNHKANFHVR